MLFLVMVEVFSRMLKRMEGASLLVLGLMVGGVEENVFRICCL